VKIFPLDLDQLLSLAWWKWIWIINSFFIISTGFLTYYPSLPVLHYLNLGGELNLASWWSGISLLLAALLSYEVFWKTTDKTKPAWLILSGIFALLSSDEISSLHERILQTDWSDFYSYATLGMIFLAYAFIKLFSKPSSRRAALFLLLGFTTLATIPFQEYLEFNLYLPSWLKGPRASLEEGSELLGFFFCFVGILSARYALNPSQSLLALLPNLTKASLSTPLLLPMATHVLSCFWLPSLTDLPDRGNPALWYPVALYFVLFTVLLQGFFASAGQRSVSQLYSCAILLLFSITVNCYKYPLEPLARFLTAHGLFYCLIVICYVKSHEKKSKLQIVLLCCLAVLLLFGFITQSIVYAFTMAGIFAYLTAQIILFTAPTQTLNDPHFPKSLRGSSPSL
jgi:hypothetical protein